MAELSGFEVLGLLKEIGEALRGAYVNNIYRFGASQLIRLRRPGEEDVWLVVSPKKGVWPSKRVEERTETTEFTTKLRTELERSKFTAARQLDLDRIFELEFQGRDARKLIVELMPPGNIIVTDSDGRVVLALQEVRTPNRKVFRGSRYQPPAQSRASPAGIRPEAVAQTLEKEKTVGGAIGRHVALPRKYVSECLARLGLDDGTPSARLQGREEEVVKVLAEMVDEAKDKPRPCICETPRGDEIFAFPPKGVRVKTEAGTISELCDLLFLGEAGAEPAARSPSEVRRKEMEATISKLRSDSAALAHRASDAREAAKRARSSALGDAVRSLGELGIRPSRAPTSPIAASSAIFDFAKELEAKSVAALESAEKLEKKLPKAEASRSPRMKPIRRRRQEWYEKFRWFHTSGGKLAVGGRDAQTNSALIGRHMEDRDTVYHADLFGSPFFILKGGEGQSEDEVRQVAQATVAFSSAWKTGLGAADAYWVRPEQVKTAAPSGEYLQRGSFAIEGRKNFVTRNLVEVAAGIDASGRVITGPEEAIRAEARRYLVLRPQREKGSDTAKRVQKDLSLLSDGSVPPGLDEVLRMLPTGGGKVVRRGGQPAEPRRS